MEKTDRVIKFAGVLLFLAMLAYIGYGVWNSVINPVQTALAVGTSVKISTPVSGIVVREESVLTSGEANLYITARDGSNLSAGETAAVAYDDEAALQRAAREQELEIEITRIESMLKGLNSTETAVVTQSIQQAVTELSAAVARQELSEMDACCLTLSSLVLELESENVSEARLAELQRELNSLKTNTTSDTRRLTAPQAGIFTSLVDGWERLTLSDVLNISPQSLRSMEQAEPDVPQSAYGKLVTSFTWYFAAVVDGEYAFQLKKGDQVTLAFDGLNGERIQAAVISVSEAEADGSRAAVFSCTRAQAESLAMRKTTAELIFQEYTGIRIPSQALHADEDGSACVYVLTGTQAEKKRVEIIYEDGDFALAKTGTAANSIHAGEEIIVSANDLYDGKVMY